MTTFTAHDKDIPTVPGVTPEPDSVSDMTNRDEPLSTLERAELMRVHRAIMRTPLPRLVKCAHSADRSTCRTCTLIDQYRKA